MLTHLHIQDFAIIPALELDFAGGFTVITGETGAGKSILVDALGLLLGDRSDSSWVRPGADKAELGAAFDLAGNHPAVQWLAQADLGPTDECLLRRSIAASGRSRAWINGTPVTLQQLGELGDLLVELHGQNEHLRLTGLRRQLQLLDASGGHGDELAATATAYAGWRRLADELAELEETAAMPAGERELLEFQLGELQRDALDPDALEALEREHRMLARGGELLDCIQASTEQLEADDHGVNPALQDMLNRLRSFESLDPGIEDARRMLEEAAINCQEAAISLQQARAGVDLSPERLAAVTAQLSTLGDLARKHRVDMEQLCAVRDALSERLENAEHFAARHERLDQAVRAALATYRSAAQALSGCRSQQARTLSDQVTGLMSDLGMAGGVFQFLVEHDGTARPSERGDDRVEIHVSANPGMPPGPLARIASGGELSRISLAIKVAARRAGSARTQVFDEVDAGIGGDTANAVGSLLQRLANGGQALCVTHLAQVAVRATHQLQVNKETGGDAPQIATRLLAEDARVDEIARMLGGQVSEQSRAHARELLDAARRADRGGRQKKPS